MIFGGYDSKGPHLCEVTATGFTTYVPFVSMGSGSMNAYAMLEAGYKDDLTLKEATELAINAIKAGIIYDNMSGANVDFVQITDKGCDYHRNHELVGKRMVDVQNDYTPIKNNIPRISSKIVPHKTIQEVKEEDPSKIQEEEA